MRARIWGGRGSIATPLSENRRYGGNTSCIEVRLDDGTLLILDAGTGARGLGVSLLEDPPARIDLLLTHLHVDHLEGLGAFEPIWQACPYCATPVPPAATIGEGALQPLRVRRTS